MTGESIELQKNTMDLCMIRLEEKLEEEKFQKNVTRANHDIPSPILLSGTEVTFFLILDSNRRRMVPYHCCWQIFLRRKDQS